ncbi:alpha-amylase family protein [Granulicella tundricola]|uniref:Alpha amylase catalytic region n=1 Tax=Granulicella tundricola (strain ATCC BAA-1859 / DSM 23138 / MP5ACTX9) TaxID=1198114 RepID=E8WZ98_GRATM|nr:alpha-amylase family glycosyl hydrolase [Granulicella tundricola]ADW67700.1 alpha amylase catalytic region [Granulicella tundricola MP5ACTX9]
MEFHIARSLREKLNIDDLLFSYTGNLVFANVAASRKLAQQLNDLSPEKAAIAPVNAGALFAMGLIDELSHAMIASYRRDIDPAVLTDALAFIEQQTSKAEVEKLLITFTEQFPNTAILRGQITAAKWLAGTTEGLPNREAALEELLLLWLANKNTAFAPFKILFADKTLEENTTYKTVTPTFPTYFASRPQVEIGSLLDALIAPMLASPDSLTGQLDYIREHWSKTLGPELKRLLLAIDVLKEEDIAIWMRFHPPTPDRFGHSEPGRHSHGFVGDEYVGFDEDFVVGADGIRRAKKYDKDHQAPLNEYEAFSQDYAWMPNVVLMAKSTYVWLEQLSKKYLRHIYRLDQIPEEELRLMADRGMTGLWLIGLWERSTASRTIKRLRGQADAVASAYSLKEYRIAEDLGGTQAYEHLRDLAARHGIRLASDMVPNHMGIDSTWVTEHPDWFISRNESPFPVYSFEGPDLSTDSRVEIKIDDHYYDQTDAAVAFRLRQRATGETSFIYHGNDGTTFAWNDTAQLDYSKAFVREQVIQTIFYVARLFPIIRFDAAMTLAKRHVQRLWFPLPGVGGSIPSRAESAISNEEFDALMPNEFWREVVDRVAVEVPGTLLLAEAFWLLEGYFVRTLGMHRVYNSAFMNMIRDEENAKYRSYLKKTIEFDPDILGRYVNFMSNPDEKTAGEQFGDGDKFFGSCTLLATLPGLPMFAHGQIEGFNERYGMDFKQARMDEHPNEGLMGRYQHEIAPLLKKRYLFAGSANFVLYDFWGEHGSVDENVFAYSNRVGDERAVVLYNNAYQSTRGTIHISAASMDKGSGNLVQRSIVDGLAVSTDDGMVLAYRDPVRDLEYLYRASDLRDRGLTVDLRGYGYVVFQNWRQLRSTEQYPWDRLADMLQGAGVRSVEEAISKLRLRPLHESLRHAICASHIAAFDDAAKKAAHETISDAGNKIEKPAPPAAVSELTLEPTPTAPFSTRLKPFVDAGITFADRAKEMLPEEPAAPTPELTTKPAAQPTPEEIATEVSAVTKTPVEPVLAPEPAAPGNTYQQNAEALATALVAQAAAALKTPTPLPANKWPITLAWATIAALPTRPDLTPAEIYDRLYLRSALAEIFNSLGLEGEEAWRAAALVRILLTTPDWTDPDLLWLAGSSQSNGITYLNKERFAELTAWLDLPAILTGAKPKAVDAITALEKAGYRLDRYLAPAKLEAGSSKLTAGQEKPSPTSPISEEVEVARK